MSFFSLELPYVRDASRYFSPLRDMHGAIWLDSSNLSRYDIISASPQHSLKISKLNVDPFVWLRNALGEAIPSVLDVPFAGGALGYWSYDLARTQLNLPEEHGQPDSIPLMYVGIYDWALLLDHEAKRARLVSHRRYAETNQILLEVQSRLAMGYSSANIAFSINSDVVSNFSRTSYKRAYEQIQQYLRAGDCYQINLAQCFSAVASGDAFEAYQKLRELSPAPYSAFMDLDGVQVLCASPERFLSVVNGEVETKPIKGTRPRSANVEQDKAYAADLAQHPKDRAENLMIVDLLRNDLGKSCEPGSVHVPNLFAVESYANVHHLVSTVRGKLAQGRNALDVLQDCFPGGSITGAPKKRAMEIIDQLEPNRRSIYCGVIGYIGFDGNMDTNIVIRTMVYGAGKICCWAGGGIVADSQCADEYQETLDKASVMLAVLAHFGGDFAAQN